MHEKIKEYVFFRLRNDFSENSLEKKEEIISNIIDRYDELFEKTKDENYSYREAIKMFGDFTEETSEKNNYFKQNNFEMFLIIGVILSVFSVISLFFSSVLSIIILMLSITCYAVGAVSLYHYSKYIEHHEYDIVKYRNYLDKVFSYLKTCFVFWSISLVVLLSKLSYFIYVQSSGFFVVAPKLFIGGIVFSVELFILVFLIILFTKMYARINRKYKELSGNDYVSSIFKKSFDFLFPRRNHSKKVDKKEYPKENNNFSYYLSTKVFTFFMDIMVFSIFTLTIFLAICSTIDFDFPKIILSIISMVGYFILLLLNLTKYKKISILRSILKILCIGMVTIIAGWSFQLNDGFSFTFFSLLFILGFSILIFVFTLITSKHSKKDVDKKIKHKVQKESSNSIVDALFSTTFLLMFNVMVAVVFILDMFMNAYSEKLYLQPIAHYEFIGLLVYFILNLVLLIPKKKHILVIWLINFCGLFLISFFTFILQLQSSSLTIYYFYPILVLTLISFVVLMSYFAKKLLLKKSKDLEE